MTRTRGAWILGALSALGACGSPSGGQALDDAGTIHVPDAAPDARGTVAHEDARSDRSAPDAASVQRGPRAFARFCDPHEQVWNLVQRSDDPRAAKLVEHEVGHCPSGRLVAKLRATGGAIEPRFEPSIGLVQDSAEGVSGPIWVRGGIPVTGADGRAYETRNRVTLCRCGASRNKPFCDGAHASIHFRDRP